MTPRRRPILKTRSVVSREQQGWGRSSGSADTAGISGLEAEFLRVRAFRSQAKLALGLLCKVEEASGSAGESSGLQAL